MDYLQPAKLLRLACAAALCALVVGEASAQQRTRRPPARGAAPTATRQQPATATTMDRQRPSEDADVKSADVSITATVKAESLKFDVVGNPTVEFTGNPDRKTVWEAERENLPTPVQPGVTYRNIGIRLKITSVFADIDRIVAEALGEVPLTEAPTGAKLTDGRPAPPARPEVTTPPPPPPRERP